MASTALLALLSAILLLSSSGDGYGLSKRIVGGTLSTRGQWPWLVSLHMIKRSPDVEDVPYVLPKELVEKIDKFLAKAFPSQDLRVGTMSPKMLTLLLEKLKTSQSVSKHQPTFEGHMCAGSLINEQWVLSAKHCFNKATDVNLTDDASRWTAELGEHSLSGIDGHERSHRISKIIMHEPLDVVVENDIALIKLSEPVEFTRHIRPITLATPAETYEPGKICAVAGWGHTTYEGEMSDEIMHIHIPLLSKRDCDPLSKVNENEFCAGGGVEDACQYDSGGPLVCLKDGVYEQLGIVARGRGCGDGHGGVYTDVRGHLRWILETMASN
ncbi:hypothetical protein Ciccas_007051 [Cichlidogyrus casuarinus]|uniref:Peptidase S1 domain-containing protein n=1 Tax=Cichlidogyrus casuarinus TaxID=1844966 RepID=A0ABD2Q409_9PLAT